MKRLLTAALLAVGFLTAGGSARAGYEFRFATSTGVEQSNFTLNFPSLLDVRVYLVSTGPDNLATTGLTSYGVNITYSGSSGAKVLAVGDITSNAAFTGFTSRAVENDGGATDFARARDSVLSGSVLGTAGTVSGENRVLLATFRFTGLANGDNLVITADPNTGTNDTVLSNGTVLDSLIANNSAVITVTNVPEPGTMILSGLLAVGVAGRAIRRRRAAPAAAA